MIQPFTPPPRRLLGPGPSDTYPTVLQALSKHTIGHLDPEFVRMMDEVKALTQYAYQTTNQLSMVVSGPGSAGMETCFVNLVEPGDKVIVCQNGVFGGRMKENVERFGGICIHIQDDWGKPVDPNKLEEALKEHPDAKIVAFVHAETSTGAQSDAKTLCSLAHQYDCITIVDTVTSLGGTPVHVDDWGIDAAYTGSQKCLSCTAGLSPITVSQKAVDAIKQRKHKVSSWFLDLNLVMQYWGGGVKRSYHHTAPINALYSMHEALLLLKQDGLEKRWAQHKAAHESLKTGLESLGFRYLVEAPYRLPQLNAVFLPEGLEEGPIRRKLLNDYNLEVGGGLGAFAGKLWRIGLMGYSARQENVDYCLASLKEVLKA